MRNPIIGNTRLRRLCGRLVQVSEFWLFKHILLPIVILMPAVLITSVATKQGLQQEVIQYFGPNVGRFINDSALLILVVAYIYVALVRGALSAVKHYSKPEKELSRNDMVAILKALNTVVGDKQKRMSAEAKKCLEGKVTDPARIFNAITRPDQQVMLLVEAIKTVFEFIDTVNASYTVGLLRVVNSRPVEWVFFAPQEAVPKLEAEELSHPTSTVAVSLKSGSIVVVQDIQNELKKRNKKDRRYLKGNAQGSENGSQLCYPIKHPSTRNIEYVVSVAGSEKRCLLEKYAGLYEWIIHHFALRILMEHSLLILKEKANERKQEATT